MGWVTGIIVGLLGRGGEAEACLLASWRLWSRPFCSSELRTRICRTAGCKTAHLQLYGSGRGQTLGVHEEHCHLLFQGGLHTTSVNYRCTHTGKLAVKESNSPANAVESCVGNRRESSRGRS